MGILSPFKCAYCGGEYRLLSWSIKGGKCVCGQCYDMLTKELPGVKWQGMTINQIRQRMADKERLDNQDCCSLCKKPFKADDPYSFILKDKTKICYRCGESTRLAIPVFCTIKLGKDYEFEEAAIDPLDELSLADIPAIQEKAAKERAGLTEKYGKHKGVFVVDDVTRYFKEQDAHQIWGKTVLGRIDKDDMLTVKRREGDYTKIVTWIDPMKYNEKAKGLLEGHCGALMVLGDVSFIYPGDVLTVEYRGR